MMGMSKVDEDARKAEREQGRWGDVEYGNKMRLWKSWRDGCRDRCRDGLLLNGRGVGWLTRIKDGGAGTNK
jgi:hypothetical protein